MAVSALKDTTERPCDSSEDIVCVLWVSSEFVYIVWMDSVLRRVERMMQYAHRG